MSSQSAAACPTVRLNNGVQMPVIGLGTYSAVKSTESEQAIRDAIDAGYRHIDTAFIYGNEHEVSSAVKAKIAEGVVKREDMFIVTKLWNRFQAPELVRMACQKSLDQLDLGPIDLYLMHTPMGFHYSGSFETVDLTPVDSDGVILGNDIDYLDTWREIEKLQNDGLVRAIGVSNFNSEQIERLLKSCSIKPTVNQVECSVHLNQRKLIEFCKKYDIIIAAYSPMGRPHYAIKAPDGPQPALYDKLVVELAAKYKKSAGQIVLKYLIQIGTVPIPKSCNKQRIIDNINIFDFELTDAEMEDLHKLNTNERMVPMLKNLKHKYYPFNIEF